MQVVGSIHKPLSCHWLSASILQTSSSNDNLEILWYNIATEDYLDIKQGVGFVFNIKTHYFLMTDVKYLHNCTSFEIRVGENCCKFVHLFRSPSQKNDKFATICQICNHHKELWTDFR